MNDLPEPYVESAPMGERLKVWAICLLFSAVAWAGLARAVGVM